MHVQKIIMNWVSTNKAEPIWFVTTLLIVYRATWRPFGSAILKLEDKVSYLHLWDRSILRNFRKILVWQMDLYCDVSDGESHWERLVLRNCQKCQQMISFCTALGWNAVPWLSNFNAADAYRFCPALPAAFRQPGERARESWIGEQVSLEPV